jgi:phosphomannomutase
MMAAQHVEQLYGAVRAWRDDDPDSTTRDELDRLLAAAESGDAAAGGELADRFSGLLEFGTAGLRGALGAGPNRMNRSVVIRAAAGLVAYLQREGGAGENPCVVIGFDARYNSDVFARDTAAVVVAAGGRALVLPHPLPTPVLAFAIRHLGADAGVMVTASHNPPQDNGYKVYLGDGSQIVPPADAQIAAHIVAVRAVAQVPRREGWEQLGHSIQSDYLEAAVQVVGPASPRDLSIVHTSLHGVGHGTVHAAFELAGFPAPVPVSEQAVPDPDFPTVSFPNPEEPGALDLALAQARRSDCDIIIANDPDADRCAAAVHDPAIGDWRMLRGDEVGALLGAHIVARGVAPSDVFANSIVSSRLLAAIAAAAGIRHEETLTGFKWISRVPGLRYGYEEALGYCVAPDSVRDKDGVTAALLLAELAATLKAQGRTIPELLDDLAVAHGVHATDSFSVRVQDLGQIPVLMDRLRTQAPTAMAGAAVTRVDDLGRGAGGLPPTEGLRYFLADGSRVIVRPSGTEPKVKVYLEVIEPVAGAESLASAKQTAASRLAGLRADLETITALP